MACVITMSHVWYGIGSISQIAPYLAGGLVVLGITQIIDSRLKIGLTIGYSKIPSNIILKINIISYIFSS